MLVKPLKKIKLLLLLVASSASPLDPDRNQQPDGIVKKEEIRIHLLKNKCFFSFLKPDPAGDVAKIRANVSVSIIRHLMTSAPIRQKIPVNSTLPEFGSIGKLQWVTWNGSLPNGSVSIHNSYAKRIDYICKVRCNSGFYNPSMGSYCHYPNKKKEHRSSSFQVLVNKDNFEILEWKEGSYGSVPQNSIRTCSSGKMYVGKNKYGLGKVDPKDKCFYLPWKGKEHWYQKSYEVLTHMKAEEDLISDVKYNIEKDKIFKEPPKTMQSTTVTNRALRPVTKTVSLRKTTKDERRWDFSFSIRVSAKMTIKAGIPYITEGQVEVTAETSLAFSYGKSWTEEISHSITLELTIPPNHSCKVKMVGYQYRMDIPFTARLSHIYEDGETRSVIISGTYHGVQVGDIGTEVERCKPLSNSSVVE
ncbi:natterin-3-like [Xiphophorus maculatus]|uniref:natterin-3-like n=1 Tax=Xiphophorus maculatus TaxID=8083 RepID=UPI000C6CADD9|nr:natterin-3-like [Xiphophorus maculatus]